MTKNQESQGSLCPNCNTPLEENAAFCYHCGSFLDPMTHRILKCGEVTDQQIQDMILRSSKAWEEYNNDPSVKKQRKGILIAVILALISVPFIFMGN